MPYEVNGVACHRRRADARVLGAAPEPDETPGAPAVAGVLALAGALAVTGRRAPRLRIAAVRPLRAVPELVQRAPAFGLVLFLAALARAGGRRPDQQRSSPAAEAQASVMAPRSAPVARRAYLASTPVV